MYANPKKELVPVTTQTTTYLPADLQQNGRNAYEMKPRIRGTLPRYYAGNELVPYDGAGAPAIQPIGPVEPPPSPKPLDEATLLATIPSIGHHRFLYSLNKYPAILSIMLGLWLLWGRGGGPCAKGAPVDTCLSWYQEALAITALVFGGYHVLVWFYGQLNHHGRLHNAHQQTVVRMVMLLGVVVLSVVKLVFATLAVVALQNPAAIHSRAAAPLAVLSHEERLSYCALLLAMALLTLLFSVASIAYGWFALHRIGRAKRRLREPLSGHTNAATVF